MNFASRYFLPLLALGIPLAALPPPVPSAGVVERELEREYEGRPFIPGEKVPPIIVDIPDETLEFPTGIKVLIREVVVSGNECIRGDEVCAAVSSYLDQELTIGQIYEMCQLIDFLYAQRGYFLARSYPPPQDIENGVLHIAVLEGILGTVAVEGNTFYSSDFIHSYFVSLVGKPIHCDRFLHQLLLLNDNMDLTAGVIFRKGQECGRADVLIRVNDCRPCHLYLNGNNYGRNLTTDTRIGGRLDCGQLLFNGDRLSVAQVIGFPVSALYFSDVRYLVPLNRHGTSIEAGWLYSQFKIEELTQLNLRGRSDILTLRLNQAIIRRRCLNIDLFSYFDYKQIQNFVLTERSSFDKLRMITVGALLDHFDPCCGRDFLTLRLSAGIPDIMGGLKAVDPVCSRPGGGGRFVKVMLDYDRLQRLPYDCFFYFHGSGQYSPSLLTLPEQIYIGGMDTVRGFPLALGLGDSGYYLNWELRCPPPFIGDQKVFFTNRLWKETLQLDVFVDHGAVHLNGAQSTFLWGTGFGARVLGPFGFTFSIDVGFPINHRGQVKDVITYMRVTGQPF